MKLNKPQTRKDYPKPSVKTQERFKRQVMFRKFNRFKATIKRHLAILLLAAGFVRMVWLESQNKIVILACGIILTVLLIEGALNRE